MASGEHAVVVSDDAERFAFYILERERWTIDVIPPQGALDQLFELRPQLLVVHLASIPQAVALCTAVRERSRMTIMMVGRQSGRRAEDELLAGLNAGANAFVTESVGLDEFVARVRAVMRRAPSQPAAHDDNLLEIGPLVLDRAARQVTVRGRRVAVPRREFDILELLMRHAPRVVPRATLRRELWGDQRESQGLDVQVRRLRARLAAEEGRSRIITIRGVGYRFVDSDPAEPDIEIDLTRQDRPRAVSSVGVIGGAAVPTR